MYIQNGVLAIISRIKSSFKSMRLRLLIALMVVGLVPAAILTTVLIKSYMDQTINEKLNNVQTYGVSVANKMLFTGFLTNTTSNEIMTQLTLLADQYDGRILVVDNSLKVITDTYGKEAGKVLLSADVINCLRGTTSTKRHSGKQRAEVMIPIISSEQPLPVGVIIMNVSLEREYAVLRTMGQKAMIYCWLIIIALFLVAFFYSRQMVKPLKAIIASIHHVSDGYMDDEVNIQGYTEIEKISDSFNEMLGRMKTLEESRQEFVSNVSHELKTPITSIKVLADSLLTQPDAPVELYREFMADINEEIERENNIITDLLSLVKLDKKTGEMHIATVSINELLEIILKRLKPIAMKRNIELVFESFRSVLAEVDEVKLSLAISNLIENAIKYNVDDGWVRVSLNADHKYFYIKVADSGIGIPENAQGNIFDRFYRVDKARARQTGGTGLGLSITKNVVLMHNGAVKVYSQENEGSTFTLRIPLSYIP